MSEFEDRQDAAPAIVAPAAEMPAPITADTADLEAVAAVEGTTDDEPSNSAEAVAGSIPLPAPAPAVVVVAAASPSPDLDGVDKTVDDIDDDEAPLLDDTLEEGIASVFAALQAAAGNGEIGESDGPFGPLSDDEAVDGVTFRLLGELDRLWHRAA